MLAVFRAVEQHYIIWTRPESAVFWSDCLFLSRNYYIYKKRLTDSLISIVQKVPFLDYQKPQVAPTAYAGKSQKCNCVTGAAFLVTSFSWRDPYTVPFLCQLDCHTYHLPKSLTGTSPNFYNRTLSCLEQVLRKAILYRGALINFIQGILTISHNL